MPALEGLNSEYRSRGLQVAGVLVDSQNADRAKLIHKKTGASFDSLLDDGTFVRKIFAVPQKFFINSQGTVVYGMLGAVGEAELRAVMDALLE